MCRAENLDVYLYWLEWLSMSRWTRAHISLRIEGRGRGKMTFHKHEISDFAGFDMSQTRALVKRLNSMHFNTYQIPCVHLYNVYQGLNKCTFNSTGWFLLWYFNLHVSAGNQAVVRVPIVLQEYSVISSVRLLHNVENHTIIG